MRDIANKVDNVDVLSGDEFNSYMKELENGVSKSGIVLDPAGGADTSFEMLAQSITRHSQGGQSYQDSGVANTYVLTSVGGFKQPSEYLDGQVVLFQAGNTNTGASTINVSSLGVVDLKDKNGVNLGASSVIANNYYFAQYVLLSNEFKLIDFNDGVSDGLNVSYYQSGVSASFPNASRVKIKIYGAGGGGAGDSLGNDGGDGGVTSLTYNGVTYTANGGEGGKSGITAQASSHGTANGGDLNVIGGGNAGGIGNTSDNSTDGTGTVGGNGGYLEVILSITPSAQFTYSVGAGGLSNINSTAFNGVDGLIKIEW